MLLITKSSIQSCDHGNEPFCRQCSEHARKGFVMVISLLLSAGGESSVGDEIERQVSGRDQQ